MIELTQMEIEIGYGDDCELIEMTRGEAIELINRLREAEKDAARYLWLRDEANATQVDDMAHLCGDKWDEAIDKETQCKSN